MSATYQTNTPLKKALLVGIELPGSTQLETTSSLQELSRLVHTLGYKVVGSISQKRSSSSGATVVGEGKLHELARWTGGPGEVQSSVEVKLHKAAEKFAKHQKTEETEEVAEDSEDESEESLEDNADQGPTDSAEVVVFDCDLTPSQMRNLESATGAQVLDRTGVIIEIFSRHARTRAAKLQVEIARLNYLAPRIRETGTGADRQGGGIGAKGAGETSYELG